MGIGIATGETGFYAEVRAEKTSPMRDHITQSHIHQYRSGCCQVFNRPRQILPYTPTNDTITFNRQHQKDTPVASANCVVKTVLV